MSKSIRLTQQEIDSVKLEFEQALTGAIADGKINFQKTFGVIQRKAELRFTELAWYKMQALIQECDKEVGWHGIARRGETSNGKDVYIIDDILVYPQEVTGTTVTPDQEQYQMWLMSHDDEVFNNIRMQGHSHVNMSTSPSGVDTTFYEQILSQLDDSMFYIFLIWNKRNNRTVKIYDMEKNVLFDTPDVEVSVIPEENGIEKFLADAKSKIKDRTPVTTNPVVYYTAQEPNVTAPATTSYQKINTTKKSGKKKKDKQSSYGDDFWRNFGRNNSDDEDDSSPYGPFGYADRYGYYD